MYPETTENTLSDFSIPRLVEPAVAARLIKKEPQTLANDRAQKRGLPFHKLGGKILYDVRDIADAIQNSRVVPSQG